MNTVCCGIYSDLLTINDATHVFDNKATNELHNNIPQTKKIDATMYHYFKTFAAHSHSI
jgi:hypothetical protein